MWAVTIYCEFSLPRLTISVVLCPNTLIFSHQCIAVGHQPALLLSYCIPQSSSTYMYLCIQSMAKDFAMQTGHQ